jgi:hypothetical protein
MWEQQEEEEEEAEKLFCHPYYKSVYVLLQEAYIFTIMTAFGPTHGAKVRIWGISVARCFHWCSLYSQYVLLTRRMSMNESTRRYEITVIIDPIIQLQLQARLN